MVSEIRCVFFTSASVWFRPLSAGSLGFFVLELQKAVRQHSHLEFHHKCLWHTRAICLICYGLQSLLCVVLSFSLLRLSSKSYRILLHVHFCCCDCFSELYERKCSWAEGSAGAMITQSRILAVYVFNFHVFSQSPWSWKKQLRMCTFQRSE